jgi:hypothetical protein
MNGDMRPAHFMPKTIGEAYEVIMIGAASGKPPSSMLVNL